MSKAIINAVLPRRNQTDVTSLIEEFQYPKYGPGMMWETCRDKVVAAGSTVVTDAVVTTVRHEGGRATTVVARHPDGTTTEHPCTDVISSMPISDLLAAMEPPVPAEVAAAAADLRYRDYMIVALVIPEELVDFDDNWIYIHDPEVRTMRIQNFGSWSPYLVKDGRTCLGLEYFRFEGDEIWSMADDDLVEMAKREIEKLGLAKASDVEAGYVVRMPKAYPVYDEDYTENIAVLRAWLEEHAPNVHPVGRNGMHRYNNQDHSMYTAMLTVENILEGSGHDVWNVNVEGEYHEEKAGASSSNGGTGRSAPVTPKRS